MGTLLIDRALCGGICICILLTALPAIRSLIGTMGIGICTLGLSFWFLLQDFNPNFVTAFRAGLLLTIPILISYEFVSALAKSLEILRGSQLAEQLFVQERGGPIEFALFLLLGTLFLSHGGAELSLSQAVLFLNGTDLAGRSTSLNDIYKTMLTQAFPLAAVGVALELLSGVFQRFSKRNLFGAEFSSLRVPLAILFLIGLLEGIGA